MILLKPSLLNPITGYKILSRLAPYKSPIDRFKSSFGLNSFAEYNVDVLVWGNDIVLNIIVAHEAANNGLRSLIYNTHRIMEPKKSSINRFFCVPETSIINISDRNCTDYSSIYEIVNELNAIVDANGVPLCSTASNCELLPLASLSSCSFASQSFVPPESNSPLDELSSEVSAISLNSNEEVPEFETLVTAQYCIKTGDPDIELNKISQRNRQNIGTDRNPLVSGLSIEAIRELDIENAIEAVNKIQ